MAYTPEQLAALERALATGEQRVTFGDRTVEYRSVDDLIAAIDVVRRGLRRAGDRGGHCASSTASCRREHRQGDVTG